jgi:hypothetical protein
MPIGLGLTPCGVTDFGYGTPDRAALPGKGLLIDSFNAAQWNARKIDPKTGQYVLAANGRWQGMSGVAQRVLLAVKTTRDKAALKDFGNPISRIQKNGTNVVKQLTDAYTQALKQLTDTKTISVLDITVSPFASSGEYVIVRWRDLTTGLEQTTSV